MFSFFRRASKHLLNGTDSSTTKTARNDERQKKSLIDTDKCYEPLATELPAGNENKKSARKNSNSSSTSAAVVTIVTAVQDINSGKNSLMAPNKKSKIRSQKSKNKKNVSKSSEHAVQAATADMIVPVKYAQSEDISPVSSPVLVQNQPKIIQSVKPNVHYSPKEGDRLSLQNNSSFGSMHFIDRNCDFDNQRQLSLKQELKINELLKTISEKEQHNNQLCSRIEELTKALETKASTIQYLQNELQVLGNQSQQLQAHFEDLKKTSSVLNAENLQLKSRNDELETKIFDLNKEFLNKLQLLEMEIEQLKKLNMELETKNLQVLETKKMLDAMTKEKSELENQFEKLHTLNLGREQKMFEDFEWKLHEVQKLCKKKLDEKEDEFAEKFQLYENEMIDKLQESEKQLNELKLCKSYEAEVKQLRGLTNDQQNSLTIMSKQLTDYQKSDRSLKEELEKLTKALNEENERFRNEKDHLEQLLQNREKQLLNDFEERKNSIAVEWEARLRNECGRLKSELEQFYSEQQTIAIRSLKNDHQSQIDQLNCTWSDKFNENFLKLEKMSQTLLEKDAYFKEELKKLQSVKDTEVVELRRTIDKMDFSYSDKIDKLSEQNSLTLEELIRNHKEEISELQSNQEKQLTNIKINFDLVADQIHCEYENQIDTMKKKHQEELGRQWEKLLEEKDNFSNYIEEEYAEQLKQLKDELNATKKCYELKENELINLVEELSGQLEAKDKIIFELQESNQQGIFSSDYKHVLNEEKLQHAKNIEQIQRKNQIIVNQLQQKCLCLTKLFETTKLRNVKIELKNEQKNTISLHRNDFASKKDIHKSKSMSSGLDRFANCSF